MAKKKMNTNPNDDNFGNEETVEEVRDGIDEATYRTTTKDYPTLNQKKDKAVSPIREMFKRFKDCQGDQKVFKIVQDIKQMSDLHRQAFWRELTKYAGWEGVFEQGDLLDHANNHDLKTGKEKTAPKSATGAAAHLN